MRGGDSERLPGEEVFGEGIVIGGEEERGDAFDEDLARDGGRFDCCGNHFERVELLMGMVISA